MEPGAKHSESATRPYFPELDGVRAVAALMVMAFHFVQIWGGGHWLILGATGVDLFFVLSGFLITMILMGSRRGDWGEIRKFYVRRTLRIFPLYYMYLGLCVAMGMAVPIWYWFYGQNIAFGLQHGGGPLHLWSLATEEQFYLVWPFLVIFLPRRFFIRALWGIVLGSLFLRLVLLVLHPEFSAISILRFDGLAAGGLLAVYYRDGRLGRLTGLLKLGVVVGVASLMFEFWMTHGSGLAWVQAVKFSSTTMLYASVVGLVIATRVPMLHAFLRLPAMRAVGRVSYGMYVFHPAMFLWLPPHLGHMPRLAGEAICFGAVYLVAAASFYSMESHFIALKNRLVPGPVQPEISMRPVQGDVLA